MRIPIKLNECRLSRWSRRWWPVQHDLRHLLVQDIRSTDFERRVTALSNRFPPSPRDLALIGSYPPPYGGVSTHVSRLCTRLDQCGADYVLYNAGSAAEAGERVVSVYRRRRLWMLWYTLFGQERCVYLVSPRIASWLAGALMQRYRRKTVAVRLQWSAQIEQLRGWMGRTLVRFALCNVSSIVCVNQELVEAVAGLGVARRNIQLFPGFLPPTPADLDPQGVPDEAWEFCRAKSPVLVANGRVETYKGHDLYGLDQLVALVARLKPDFPQIGLVVCFWEYSTAAQARLNELLARAREHGIAENIFFNLKPSRMVPLLQRADVFLRPTMIDGDANSIREALYFGVPAVASDAVSRPEGTMVYRNRDLSDFEAKVRQALGAGRPEAAARAARQQKDEERAAAYVSWLRQLRENHA